jgi:hypothetical protein
MERLKFFAFLLTLAFPIVYSFVILWGAKYQFRGTVRNFLVAMTLIALLFGFASALASWLDHSQAVR